MGRFSRSLILRVLAGAILIIFSFYWRQAHACGPGEVIHYGTGACMKTSRDEAASCILAGINESQNRSYIRGPGNDIPNHGECQIAQRGGCISHYFYQTGVGEGRFITYETCAVPATPTCPAGQHYNGTQCIADSCPAEGTKDTRVISGTPGGSYCHTVPNGSNCSVNVVIGMNIVGGSGSTTWNERTYTGQSCTTPTQDTSTPTEPVQTPAGTFTPDGSEAEGRKGCGYMDGKYICLGQPPANGRCTITPNGGSVCVTSTDPSKPASTPPDNGIPGRPAVPQATASTTPTGASQPSETTSFFSPAQVNNSTNYGGTGTGNQGDGDGDGEGGGGEGAFKGPGGTAKTFSEALTGFKGRVAASQVGSALEGFSDGIPTGGQCPTASFTALGHQFTFDKHCPLLDQFKAIISAIFLLGWAIYATVLFFKA